MIKRWQITSGLALAFAVTSGCWTLHALENPDQVENLPDIDLVTYAKSAPRFQPTIWNDLAVDFTNAKTSVQLNSNCYAYALNNKIQNHIYSFPAPGMRIPGDREAQIWRQLAPVVFTSRDMMIKGAVHDGLQPIKAGEKVPEGYYLVALFVRPGMLATGGFHWYRLDIDEQGKLGWSHKLGNTAARDSDEDNKRIEDLSKSNRGKYLPQFGGYFIVPQQGIKFDPPTP